MQQVVIQLIQYAQKFVDILNYKFYEVLLVMEATLDTLKAQGPTIDVYDKLSKKINLSYQKVLEKIGSMNFDTLLASKARPSHARRGEMVTGWKPSLEFKLRDDSSDEDYNELMVEGVEGSEKDEVERKESDDDREI